jgi:uncharacterized protein YfdQ (DUF2303 family)
MTGPTTEAQSIIDLAVGAYGAEALTLGSYYVMPRPDGGIERIDLTGNEYRDYPRRVTGTAAVDTVASLLAYWDKHHTAASDVFTDRTKYTLTAVIDAHAGTGTAPDAGIPVDWQGHRAVCTLVLSDPLATWLNRNNKLMGQEDFAEFVEQNIPFIAEPPVADLKEMAETFQATTTAEFKAGVKFVSGQRTLQYNEHVDASVRNGSIPVPSTLTLALPIWRGDTEARLFTARLRYRANTPSPGKLSIGYVLDRPQDVIDAAFAAAVTQVAEHVGRPVLSGSPLR